MNPRKNEGFLTPILCIPIRGIRSIEGALRLTKKKELTVIIRHKKMALFWPCREKFDELLEIIVSDFTTANFMTSFSKLKSTRSSDI